VCRIGSPRFGSSTLIVSAPLEDLGLVERVLRIEDAAAEILERHVLQRFIDH
jgi:hypothetical protein